MTTEYTVHMRCEDGGNAAERFEADSLEAAAEEAQGRTEEWLMGGDWGEDGSRVSGWWTLEDADGDEVDEGSATVEIEPDHDALIRRACGGRHSAAWESCCGGDPDDHDWTSEGEGGCSQNPGCWSVGGTAMVFASHCRTCGLRRVERHTGSQRNPGEHDTVRYEMPEQVEE